MDPKPPASATETDPPPSRAGRRGRVLGLCLVLWGGVVVAFALPRAIQPGDAGEMATVMLRGGVPHPSGYPWIRALGPLARGLEALGLPPASAAALPCAALTVAAGVVLYGTLCRVARPWIAASLVALLLASPPFVAHAYDAEVFGPLLFATALFMALATREAAFDRQGPAAPPFVLGLALGLATTVHLSAVWLVPLAVAAAWPTKGRRELGAIARAGALGLAGSVVGLAFFATLALGRGGAWRWGEVEQLAGLLRHVTRAEYGVLALSLHTDAPPLSTLWTRSFANLGDTLTVGALGQLPPPLAAWLTALALGGLVLAWLRSKKARLPWSLRLGLALSLAGAAALFPALGNIDPRSPFGAWILARFDLLALWLSAPALAWALERASKRGQAVGLTRRLRPLFFGALPVLLAAQAARAWPARPALERGVQAYAVDMLASAPPGAVIFGTDDHRTFPALFAREVLGVRSDVIFVDASLLAHPWYRRWLAERRPDIPWRARPLETMGAAWEASPGDAPPFLLANVFSRPAAALELLPEGLLLRVRPPAAQGTTPDPEELIARHLAALEKMRARPGDFAGRLEGAHHPFSADLWWIYADRHGQLVTGARRSGREDLAQRLEAAWTDKFVEAATRPR